MFTSQSLRAVVRPGALAVREQRLDDVVHHIELRGTLDEANAPEMARRVDAALASGVRWLIVDLAETANVADGALNAIVAKPPRSLSGAGTHDVAHRPALAANVDQALMILKMLRPKTDIHRSPQRARQRITSLTLPRIEPTG